MPGGSLPAFPCDVVPRRYNSGDVPAQASPCPRSIPNPTLCDNATTTETFGIPALSCPDEMVVLEKALGRLPGVASLMPDYLNRALRVEFRPDQVDAATIAASIRRLGFDVEPGGAGGTRPVEPDRPWRHLSTTSGGLLLLSAALARLWLGETTTAVAGLAVGAAIVSGIPVVRAAARALRARVLDMNVLMTIAAVGAVAIGDCFEAATAMFLFAISIWLESFSMDRARRAVQTLIELAPAVAHRLDGEASSDVDVAELRVGDRVLVKPGERIPVDGAVVAGASAVNQAPVTGESMPVEKEPGDGVFAGSLNGEGSLEVRVGRTADSSTLAHIARLVAQTQGSPAPTERFIHGFARRYTPAVILLAFSVAFVMPLLGWLGMAGASATEASEWFHRGLVLLVIACPCALVISTPVTIVSGLFGAARRGLLIKGGAHLENAGRIDGLALDKTGTLTTGTPQVVGVEPLDSRTADEVLSVAARLERHSEHPLAEAIVAAAARRGLTGGEVADFSALRGFGIRGRIDGQTVYVGSPRLFREQQIGTDSEVEKAIEEADGTLALVGTAEALWGVIRLADPARPDAAAAVAELKRIGIRPVVMLSGDRPATARHLAETLGIDEVHAGLLPEDKVACVRRLAARYPHLAMVGDGVNDAPALAAAHLGIALGAQSSDTALETADVVVMTPQLGRLGELVRLGRRCRRILAENITLALSIKAIVLLLAVAGLATMWMAVAADVGASILVTFNGMRMATRDRRRN